MVFPTGSLVNLIAIVLGSCAGMLLGNRLPERVRYIVFCGLGLATLVIGMQMALKTQNPLILVFSILLGGITGELLQIERGLNSLGERLKKRLKSNNLRFVDGFVSATLLFVIGSMAILGPFDEALRGDRTLLYTKSILDCFASVPLAASFGSGVLFSAVPVFLYQGALTLFAGVLQPMLTPAMMNEIIATGGLMILGIALGLLDVKRIPLSNLLPSLVYAGVLSYFFM
ncbi:protein of unknown function DUF554 [Oleidesulfovibrio alaskensis G20]|uniref:DUF554 domain-containing protein n=1 Tax=Oleidesulfovibrio alaskensis (strain ATCC BAA-1058 / DSM 17464 / G20) TaxID=207559 RepID=Q30YG1_OLEA2|nr:DUF554 domain-containing protein [Oleidesulfovibrio alaskensis]ABB39285.1 protein of unknown function DUF554 [Oleidesulfovibrio alaskensis G20]MBG0771968.1 DUF554 domain-containing protein [Oleidesulfovibrio alaskensis]MBL3581794.1 DUF554 domain-containing protein [Oleidesulfovibrio alaskensis]